MKFELALADANNLVAISKTAEAYEFRGFVYWRKKQFAMAGTDYAEAMKIDPNYANAYCGRALMAQDANIPYESAIADWNRCVVLKPTTWNYQYRAEFQYDFKKYDLAVADFGKSIDLDGNDRYRRRYEKRGMVYEALKKYDLAIADYTKAIEVHPEESSGYLFRGNIYWSHYKDKDTLALADFNKAVEVAPKYSYVYARRGQIYFYLKRFDSALSDYNKAVELDAKIGWYYEFRADVYDKTKRKDLAAADRQKAKELAAKQ